MRLKKIFEDYQSEDNIDELREILDQIIELMSDANDIVAMTARATDPIIYERWKAYPYGHITSMLAGGSKYDTTFMDIIDELEEAVTGEKREREDY